MRGVLRLLLIVGLLFGAPISLVARAQTGGPSIQLHGATQEPINTASGTSLSLKVAFSLLDANRQLLQSEIESASLEVGGEVYTPTLTQAEAGWSIVFVMDASKAMADVRASSALKTARSAVADALGKAPRDSLFAVLQFHDQAPTIQEFTPRSEDIATALRSRWQPRSGGNACLNDAIAEAVNKLSGVPRQKAVVVFTASGDTCARPAQSVIDLAVQNGVQIYAVGLEGSAITRQELDNFANATTGLADLRPENELRFAFDNVMAVLSNQWLAAASLYPLAGPHHAVLKLTLADTTQVTSPPIAFTSDQDYVRPAEIRLKGAVVSSGADLVFTVEAVSPTTIKQLNVSVLRKDTEQPVITQSLSEIRGTLKIPATNLTRGVDYRLVVTAVDDTGRTLSEDFREFRYEPEQPSLAISAVSIPTLEAPQFVITVTSQNLEGVVKYKVWLADAQSTEQTPIAGTERTISVGDAIIIPADELESGSFLVIVQALDSSSNVLAEAAPAKASYERPSAFTRLVKTVSESPLAIAGITGACCLAVLGLLGLVWLVMPKPSAKPKTVELVLPEKARRAAPPPPAPRPEPPRAEPPRPAPKPAPQPVAATVRAAMPVATLTLTEPANVKFSAQINKTPYSVGRREGNDAVLPVDNSSGVSSQHLTITFADGQFYVQDDKSTFGTTLNGQAIPKGRPARLEEGVVIGLGPNVKVQFRVIK
jgi:Mg-chelatase subunit ChlD